jgi:hypothetical protein
MQKNKTNG